MRTSFTLPLDIRVPLWCHISRAHLAWRHPTFFAQLGLPANDHVGSAAFLPGTLTFDKFGLYQAEASSSHTWVGIFRNNRPKQWPKYFTSIKDKKKLQALSKIISRLYDFRHFHDGTAYEHQMRVGLLLSKFDWPKVISLAYIITIPPQQSAVNCR